MRNSWQVRLEEPGAERNPSEKTMTYPLPPVLQSRLEPNGDCCRATTSRASRPDSIATGGVPPPSQLPPHPTPYQLPPSLPPPSSDEGSISSPNAPGPTSSTVPPLEGSLTQSPGQDTGLRCSPSPAPDLVKTTHRPTVLKAKNSGRLLGLPLQVSCPLIFAFAPPRISF